MEVLAAIKLLLFVTCTAFKSSCCRWIGLRDNLQETTPIFHGKNHGFRLRFPLKPIQ